MCMVLLGVETSLGLLNLRPSLALAKTLQVRLYQQHFLLVSNINSEYGD